MAFAAAALTGLCAAGLARSEEARAWIDPGLDAVTPAFARHLEGPPPGHTGGFGEPTCQACHIGLPLNEPGSTLTVEGLPERYRPGETYTVTVRLESPDMAVAGFQAAFRRAEGPERGRSAGSARATGDRVAVVPDSTGTVYIQHTRAGARTDGGVVEWRFEWTAPEGGRPVGFHVAANSGGGDNSPLEDLIYTRALLLTPEGARR